MTVESLMQKRTSMPPERRCKLEGVGVLYAAGCVGDD